MPRHTALDNIETKHGTTELVNFMLTASTGISNEKRKRGSDHETVNENTKCLINTNGIEPLGGEFAEVVTRTFIVDFSIDKSKHECFLETDVLEEIRKHRDYLMSAIFIKTQHVLKLIQQGIRPQVMTLFKKEIKENSKSRANDYLALMYLFMKQWLWLS